MEPYQNKSGNSGVSAYDIDDDRVSVKFNGGDVYTYSYASAGKRIVEQMKILAQAGEGLSTFISQQVKDKYEH